LTVLSAWYSRSLWSKGGDFRTVIMPDDPDYIGLSRRFALWAERATDPLLADAYRKLSQTYRALDFWHERFRERYENTVEAVNESATHEGDASNGIAEPESPAES
jgi:hypothetical protein